MPRTERQIEKEMAGLTLRLQYLQTEREAVRRNKTLQCQGCSKRTKVSTLTYIQTHWYEEPHGCTGGARWHEGEGQWHCPKCSHQNRAYYDKKIVELKRYFKTKEDTYT